MNNQERIQAVTEAIDNGTPAWRAVNDMLENMSSAELDDIKTDTFISIVLDEINSEISDNELSILIDAVTREDAVHTRIIDTVLRRVSTRPDSRPKSLEVLAHLLYNERIAFDGSIKRFVHNHLMPEKSVYNSTIQKLLYFSNNGPIKLKNSITDFVSLAYSVLNHPSTIIYDKEFDFLLELVAEQESSLGSPSSPDVVSPRAFVPALFRCHIDYIDANKESFTTERLVKAFNAFDNPETVRLVAGALKDAGLNKLSFSGMDELVTSTIENWEQSEMTRIGTAELVDYVSLQHGANERVKLLDELVSRMGPIDENNRTVPHLYNRLVRVPVSDDTISSVLDRHVRMLIDKHPATPMLTQFLSLSLGVLEMAPGAETERFVSVELPEFLLNNRQTIEQWDNDPAEIAYVTGQSKPESAFELPVGDNAGVDSGAANLIAMAFRFSDDELSHRLLEVFPTHILNHPNVVNAESAYHEKLLHHINRDPGSFFDNILPELYNSNMHRKVVGGGVAFYNQMIKPMVKIATEAGLEASLVDTYYKWAQEHIKNQPARYHTAIILGEHVSAMLSEMALGAGDVDKLMGVSLLCESELSNVACNSVKFVSPYIEQRHFNKLLVNASLEYQKAQSKPLSELIEALYKENALQGYIDNAPYDDLDAALACLNKKGQLAVNISLLDMSDGMLAHEKKQCALPEEAKPAVNTENIRTMKR